MFERYIPWMIYAKDRDIVEFYFTIPNQPEQLGKILKIFAKHGINILSLNTYALPEWQRQTVFIFADITNLDVNIEQVRRELEIATGGEGGVKKPPVKGFMIDEFAYPLYVFPGVRSVILLEHDLQEMIKGLYEKIGEGAAVLLYYLACLLYTSPSPRDRG